MPTPPTHRIHIDAPLTPGDVEVSGDEAHHAARVKRLTQGQAVELLNGRGGVGVGVVTTIDKVGGRWRMGVRVSHVRTEARVVPGLEVCTALPKGAMLGEMIDALAQVGVAVWRPLESERSVRESARRDKLERIAIEAGKQCGRAWNMDVGEPVALGDAIRGGNIVLADASGERYEPGHDTLRLLIGPEGGWTEEEIRFAREAGVHICRFGVHTMRIGIAAVVAAGLIIEAGPSRR